MRRHTRRQRYQSHGRRVGAGGQCKPVGWLVPWGPSERQGGHFNVYFVYEPLMVILYNLKSRVYFGYSRLLVRMT